jgi:pimeloyl-ACP methyl ester carboxylesterase
MSIKTYNPGQSRAGSRNQAAYRTLLQQWPVPYEELVIPTRFGATSVIASGSIEAPAMLILHPDKGQKPRWVGNIGILSRSYRVYAVDLIGALNKSARPIRSHRKFMDWMADLFDGLQIESADLVSSSNGWFFAFETAFYLPGRARLDASAFAAMECACASIA